MKQSLNRICHRAASLLMAGAILLTGVGAAMPLLRGSAEEIQTDVEYEQKKAAYREKLKNHQVTSNDLLIGSWVSFYSFETDSYEYQLDQMAAAGINFNIFPRNFGGGSMSDPSYWDEVEAQYAKRNMVYLMNGGFSTQYVDAVTKMAQDKAHCIGFHLVDEPGGSALPTVAQVTKAFREADTVRYPFTNLLPSYAGEAWLGGTYRQHIERYVQLCGVENIDYLSHDFYAFQGSGNTNMGIFADMEVMRSVAYENGKLKTHAFPQSTAWNGMRMPSIDEMRWNVYAYLAYGFKALSWFNLVCPGNSDTEGEGFRDSLIYRDGTIRDPELFAAWGELNWEIRGLSDALMNLDTVHAYHTNANFGGVETLPSDFFITPLDSRAELVISYMEAKDGTDSYIMIFNRSLRRKADLDFFVDLSSGVEAIEYLDPYTGEYIPMDISEGKMHDSYIKGQGKLYRLKGNVKTNEAPEAPTVDLESGLYTGVQTVTITPPAEGATVYYTLDGSYPTSESTRYEGPFSIGKENETSAYTLRVATVKGDSISPVVTKQYIIDSRSGKYRLIDVNDGKVTSHGTWSKSGDSLSLTGGADDTLLNYYLDTSRTYETYFGEAAIRFDPNSNKSASAGILFKAAEGDTYLYAGVTQGGALYVSYNNKRITLSATGNGTIDTSKKFTLRVCLAGRVLLVEVNGEYFGSAVLNAAMPAGYAGINASKDCVITAEMACFSALDAAPAEPEVAISTVDGDSITVTVGRNAAKEEIAAKLPQTARITDENGKKLDCTLNWALDELDTSSGGTFTVRGYPVVPTDSAISNPHKKALRCTIHITYDPDRTELNEAMALWESLKEANYTAETWAAAKQAYENALGLKDADVPQNAVTVAAVFLKDKLNALEPVGLDFTALEAAITSLKALDLQNASDEIRAMIGQILTEAEGFTRKGAITQETVDALVARLKEAEDAYKASTATETDFETDAVSDDTAANDRNGKGCASAVSAAGSALMLATGAAAALRKKKES